MGGINPMQVEMIACRTNQLSTGWINQMQVEWIKYYHSNQMQGQYQSKTSWIVHIWVESTPCRLKWLYRGRINQVQVESIKCRLNGSNIINAGWMDQTFVIAIPCRSKSIFQRLLKRMMAVVLFLPSGEKLEPANWNQNCRLIKRTNQLNTAWINQILVESIKYQYRSNRSHRRWKNHNDHHILVGPINWASNAGWMDPILS